MKEKLRFTLSALMWAVLLLAAYAVSVHAQTTAFTYQGKLVDNGNLANATYDIQFKLFDTVTVGTGVQQGSSVTASVVPIANGIFTVQLDFGASAFPGADRFLEIAIKQPADSTFTTLAPRQPVSSTPYAIRSLKSISADGLSVACVNCITSSQIQNVQGAQITGTISVASIPPGSSNYIQNTTSQQASANFNISGTGAANTFNASSQYQIASSRVLSIAGTNNTFAGVGAGAVNTGAQNSFFGTSAGTANTSGFSNAFFGDNAGATNALGSFNSFFGHGAGFTSTASGNAFFGFNAGSGATTGIDNSFFGRNTGSQSSTGTLNTLIGAHVDTLTGVSLTNATAIGAHARVDASNSLVLGSMAGVNGAAASTNVGIGTSAPATRLHVIGNAGIIGNLGVGTTAPATNLHVVGNTGITGNLGVGTTSPAEKLDVSVNSGHVLLGDAGCSAGFIGLGFGSSLGGCANYSMVGNGTDTIVNRPTGGTIAFREANATQMSIAPGGAVTVNGTLAVFNISSPGDVPLCYNGVTSRLALCSSSLRYKDHIQPFTSGLDLIRRLRPISFTWKQNGAPDIGFGAEDVAKVEPRLVIYNKQGEVEGLKYDRISAALVNAVKEQQEQIDGLKKIVCSDHPDADLCKRLPANR